MFLQIEGNEVYVATGEPERSYDQINKFQDRMPTGNIITSNNGNKDKFEITTIPLKQDEYEFLMNELQNTPPYITIAGDLLRDDVNELECDVEDVEVDDYSYYYRIVKFELEEV